MTNTTNSTPADLVLTIGLELTIPGASVAVLATEHPDEFADLLIGTTNRVIGAVGVPIENLEDIEATLVVSNTAAGGVTMNVTLDEDPPPAP